LQEDPINLLLPVREAQANILYNLVNHRTAFLSGPLQHPDVKKRFTGFTRAMETHGLPVEVNPHLL